MIDPTGVFVRSALSSVMRDYRHSLSSYKHSLSCNDVDGAAESIRRARVILDQVCDFTRELQAHTNANLGQD